jgi:hypothetical protein
LLQLVSALHHVDTAATCVATPFTRQVAEKIALCIHHTFTYNTHSGFILDSLTLYINLLVKSHCWGAWQSPLFP